MNQNILFRLHHTVTEATNAKKLHTEIGNQQFNHFKGVLVGIGKVCKELGYDDEFKLSVKLAREYPFTGEENDTNPEGARIISL